MGLGTFDLWLAIEVGDALAFTTEEVQAYAAATLEYSRPCTPVPPSSGCLY